MYILLIKALLWLEYKIVVIIVNSSKTNSSMQGISEIMYVLNYVLQHCFNDNKRFIFVCFEVVLLTYELLLM